MKDKVNKNTGLLFKDMHFWSILLLWCFLLRQEVWTGYLGLDKVSAMFLNSQWSLVYVTMGDHHLLLAITSQ